MNRCVVVLRTLDANLDYNLEKIALVQLKSPMMVLRDRWRWMPTTTGPLLTVGIDVDLGLSDADYCLFVGKCSVVDQPVCAIAFNNLGEGRVCHSCVWG